MNHGDHVRKYGRHAVMIMTIFRHNHVIIIARSWHGSHLFLTRVRLLRFESRNLSWWRPFSAMGQMQSSPAQDLSPGITPTSYNWITSHAHKTGLKIYEIQRLWDQFRQLGASNVNGRLNSTELAGLVSLFHFVEKPGFLARFLLPWYRLSECSILYGSNLRLLPIPKPNSKPKIFWNLKSATNVCSSKLFLTNAERW